MTSARADMLVDGAPVSGSLFDFGMYFFHNAHDLLKRVRSANATFFFSLLDFFASVLCGCHMVLIVYCMQGSGPYFYLPKMESHLEARLWNDVFNFSESQLGLAKYVQYFFFLCYFLSHLLR